MLEPDDTTSLDRLEADGFLHRSGDRLRTTRRFQAAMMRAAASLVARGDRSGDLALPVSMALVEHYGKDLDAAQIAALVAAMLPIEARELSWQP